MTNLARQPTGAAGGVFEYLRDPFLGAMYGDISRAGALRSISLDITHKCNLRCEGCYYFAEDMDANGTAGEAEFEAFIRQEKERGTNFITVVGGEPALQPDRLRALHREFKIVTVTNGTIPIAREGMEDMPIAISVWGDHATDTKLRGRGERRVFAEALELYRGDERVTWYYTTTPGKADEIEPVVDACVANGNTMNFNFYGDIQRIGGDYDHRAGFARVHDEICRMIDKYPAHIFMSSYLSETVAKGRLYTQKWGHEVCGSITADHPLNAIRIKNGMPFSSHFRAYMSDLRATRRCCVGNERDCGNCYDVWAHQSWIMMNAQMHMGSIGEFTNWLGTTYIFYVMIRAVPRAVGMPRLPEIHRRLGYLRT